MFTGYELIVLDIFIVNMVSMLFVLYYLKKCYSCWYAELIPIKCLAAFQLPLSFILSVFSEELPSVTCLYIYIFSQAA
jgi:hypothetical protein